MCLVLQCDYRFVSIETLSQNRHCANRTAYIVNHLQWEIWFIVIRQTKHYSYAVYYFCDPNNVGCFLLSLSSSLRRFCLYQHFKISQRTVNKTAWSNPSQTRICYIFRLWVIIKALLKQFSLYLLSHILTRIRTRSRSPNSKITNQQALRHSEISGLNFPNFRMSNGTVFSNWPDRSRSIPAWAHFPLKSTRQCLLLDEACS